MVRKRNSSVEITLLRHNLAVMRLAVLVAVTPG